MEHKEIENAVISGDLKLIQKLKEIGVSFDFKDGYGRTIIYHAIIKGYDKIVEELCLSNVNLNNQDNEGKTPLHFACIHRQQAIAKVLIEYGADVNLRDNFGNNALTDAIFYSKGDTGLIALLIENGADYKTPNKHGISPKDLAESIANFDVTHIIPE